jgi:predicted RNA-binding protein (virulence factor B family)
LYNDEESDRLVASAKIHKFLNNEELTIEEGQEVDILVGEPTDLGYNVIINNRHSGLIFHNEIFQNIDIGDQIKAYIKKIRADYKIDVSLQKQGYQNIEPSSLRILNYLKAHNGYMELTDKSKPADIMIRFEMSKKSFKKALGALYKQKLVRLAKDGVYLIG